MKADIECHGCCVRKAEGLLEQYQVPDEKKAQVMEAVLETVKGGWGRRIRPGDDGSRYEDIGIRGGHYGCL